ncbi:polysaccharide biosynthesis C-terminal domain-containing protein [Algoriphagus sp. AK58]|uniref:oligosaccharide flippase family protein n=1 Tax=Algoriphagus sp. AK58 TaxID=1406877 RepID=UPI00164FE53A|nr:polysaccharide biosynthesis C-terminal domain-containing protein [Algoriphagus sp. AK58]MBC6369211.1 multidrug transporter MatE [Algoriphagus sp. AK58]
MIEKNSSFISDFLRVGISQIFIIIFGLATSIITARYIGPEGNGIIAGLTVYPSLFMTIGSLGIRQSTTYFLGKGIFSEEEIKTAITQIWIMTTFFSLIVSFILMYYFSNSGTDIILVLLALLPIPFSLFNIYNSGIFLGKNDIKTFNKINWIPSLISLIGTIILIVLMQLDVKGAMTASTGGPLFMFFMLLFKNKFLAFFSFRYNWGIIKQMLSLGIIYATALFVINLNYRIDIILLDKLSSAHQLGIYSKGAGITQYLWQIPMLLSSVVFARSAVSTDDYVFSLKVAQLLRVSFVVVGIVSIGLFAFSEILIIGMYGDQFSDSIAVLNYLLPGVLILTIFKVMNMDLAGKGKPWLAIYAMLPSLLVNILLNFYLIPKYGAAGAAGSSSISYSIAAILFLIIYSRAVRLPIKEILSFSKKDFDPIFKLIPRLS